MPEINENQLEYVEHSLLVNDFVEKRDYQTKLAQEALEKSSLIALPTGTGKTVVSLIVTAERIKEIRGRALFLAPTKPLVEQQASFYADALDIPNHEISVFTGDVRPNKREEEWQRPRSVVFATPQVVQNDLIAERISLEDVVHLTFDESHRATGGYSYTYIAEKYWKEAKSPLVTGLSASPGANRDDILTIAQNLGVTNIDVVTEDSPDLKPYLYETKVLEKRVKLDDEIHEMRDLLYDIYAENLGYLKKVGALKSRDKYRTGFKQLQRGMAKARKLDEKDKYKALSVCSESMKLDQTIEVLETQGVERLCQKLDALKKEAKDDDSSKSVKRLVNRDRVANVHELARSYSMVHPKKTALITSLKDIIIDGGQALVFTQYRETAFEIVSYLETFDPITPHRFVGQNNEDGAGMTQKEQKKIIQEFRNGKHNVLVATSVAEEGLDIPQVNLVVFFEPVPSGIRAIQRRGRTGRAGKGEVHVLIAKGTRDEGYWQASKSRESSMETGLKKLDEMSDELNAELSSNQQSLSQYKKSESGDPKTKGETMEEPSEDVLDNAKDVTQSAPEEDSSKIEIITDTREMSSSPPRLISLRKKYRVTQEKLEVGDFILSDRVAVERKSAQDFADTLVSGDRSIFDQLADLVNNYSRPLLILEGTQEALYEARNIHENAIRGTLASLAVDFGVSVLWARNEKETAELLMNIAKREQTEKDREVSVHGKKTKRSESESLEYIISSMAGIGPVTAEALLVEHGSIHEIMNADVESLKNAEGIGEKIANNIYEIIRLEYDEVRNQN